MLNITFATQDTSTAEALRDLLAKSPALTLESPLLIVLASHASMADATVQATIADARTNGTHIAVLKLDNVAVPAQLGELKPLDISRGLHEKRIVAHLNRAELGRVRIRRNGLLFAGLGVAILTMFGIALWGVGSGQVAFPIDEFATENAFNEQQIQLYALPTLEQWMPRSTDDALNFMATADAVPTRFYIYLLQTATAIPQNANATQQAIATAAEATALALTAQPTPTATP